jgi:uncharacterized protein
MTASPASTDATTVVDAFGREWEEWHRHHEGILADPHGFLSITSIHWLTSEDQVFHDVPGRWSTGPEGVIVALNPGEELVVDGTQVVDRHCFGVIPERASIFAGFGNSKVEVAKRCGYDLIRPRHPDNPLRVSYHGTPAYPPDPKWVVGGRYDRFDEPVPTTVGAAVEGLEHVYHAVGRVEFELEGRQLALTAFPGRPEGHLLVLFTDDTSGVTTYSANRSLVVGPVAPDGSVTVDFNRAVNLPCAYTDLATCPLPPAENRLPIAIEAGEKIPYERLTG